MVKRSRSNDKTDEVILNSNKRNKSIKSTSGNSGNSGNSGKSGNSYDASKNLWNGMLKYERITGIREQDEWISGTSIRNYMLNDAIMDWLDRYYLNLGFNDGTTITTFMKDEMEKNIEQERNKMTVLFNNGLSFESAVFDELKRKYPDDHVQIGYTRDDVNDENYQKTIESMKSGISIIMQAVLINHSNKTRGMADLLIRSDRINAIFGENQIPEDDISIPSRKLGTNFHYRVIDIKWTTLHLCSDGKLIRNDERIPAYKGQLAIYNSILGHTQGYYSKHAYILGHAWKYETCGDKFSGSSCFDLLGHIDYGGFDKQYIERTIEAMEWVRNLRCNGSKWKLIPPSMPQLYPNMSNSNDTPWSEVKTLVANKINELTQLWQVGPKNRDIGHSNNVFKWSDKGCNASTLGINGKKIAPILDKIIDINQSDNSIISPDIITNNDMDWQVETSLDFFVDFETLNGCFMKAPDNVYNNKSDTNIIFLIGIGYCEDQIWKYKSFKMEKLNTNCELQAIDEWLSFVDEQIEKYKLKYKRIKRKEVMPRFFHWSNAEITSINIANNRHNYRWSKWLKNIVWIDMCKIFQNEPIVVKGSLRFKLKDIAKSMHSHGLIKTVWDTTGISDGLSAMIDAIEYYKLLENGSDNNSDTMNQIEKYNEIDCKVIWEIVEYLRNNRT